MIRRITSIEYGSTTLIFPRGRFDAESTQELNNNIVDMSGADYQYDALRGTRASKKNGSERISFVITGTTAEINEQIDTMRANLFVGAKFKLWATGDLEDDHGDSVADRRWAQARVVAMPTVTLATQNRNIAPITIVFTRFTDWYSEEEISGTIAMASSPQTFTLINPGTARILNPTMTIRGVFTNPIVINLTNSYRLKSTRDGSDSADYLRFKANGGPGSVEFSPNAGVNWTGDYANFVRKTNQITLMALEPGENDFYVSGVIDGDFDYAYFAAWH